MGRIKVPLLGMLPIPASIMSSVPPLTINTGIPREAVAAAAESLPAIPPETRN